MLLVAHVTPGLRLRACLGGWVRVCVGVGSKHSGVSLYKEHLSVPLLHLILITPQRSYLQTSHWGLGFQHTNWRENKHLAPSHSNPQPSAALVLCGKAIAPLNTITFQVRCFYFFFKYCHRHYLHDKFSSRIECPHLWLHQLTNTLAPGKLLSSTRGQIVGASLASAWHRTWSACSYTVLLFRIRNSQRRLHVRFTWVKI